MKKTSRLLASCVFIFLLALPASAAFPLLPSVGPAGPEISAEFRAHFEGREAISREARAKVKGWTRPFVEGFLRNYGGSIEALEDMKQEQRKVYLEANLARIEELFREVPTIAMSTQKDYAAMPFDLQTLVFLFDPNYLRNESDGMIAIRDSMFPFTPFVFFEGVDHGETTQKGRLNRVRLLHSILSFLLKRAS